MMPSFGLRLVVLMALALLMCQGASARAQISIEGPADAVRIDVVDAPLRDVLDALQAKFALHYRSNGTLEATRTVRLDAPLNRVVARLLDGYDFVIAVAPDGIDVLVLQQGPATAVAPARAVPAAAPATSVAAQGRRPERD